MNYTWLFVLLVALTPVTAAGLELDAISFDPAIIASGDEIDIVVQFHHEVGASNQERINDPAYTYRVELLPDDALAEEYVTIIDAVGDDVRGMVISGGYYNKRFRVKISPEAPAADYEFKLVGQWSHNGVPLDDAQFMRFRMPVKKAGILLGLGTQQTTPADIRAADTYVHILTQLYNSGEKDAHDVTITVKAPEGIDASYSTNNRVYLSTIPAGLSAPIDVYVDVDQDVAVGDHDLQYVMTYRDEDRNEYQKILSAPLFIRSSPYLEVTMSQGEGLAGGEGLLTATIKNTGTEAAEHIDARILVDSAQPFHAQRRSEYLGALAPGEERDVTFMLDIAKDATFDTHSLTLLLRAKGDADEGDDNIYTYSREAMIDVTGKTQNTFLYVGLAFVALIVLVLIVRKVKK